MSKIDVLLTAAANKTEAAMRSYLPDESKPGVSKLTEAMQYSLFSGGKRIRPYLTLVFCKMFGGEEKKALALASALEMVHTYSLIHDDLPCVDNDELRRGRPTNHMIYGEAGALFAGDALLTRAFGVLSETLTGETLRCAVSLLSEYAGARGMLGGQMLDMEAEVRSLSYDELLLLHEMKTGALIRTAVRFGLLAANLTDEAVIADADEYAANIGVSFQIVDDVLDRCGDTEELGKSTGSDEASGKTTFLTFFSAEEAMQKAKALTERAISAIKHHAGSEEAVMLAEFLLKRKS